MARRTLLALSLTLVVAMSRGGLVAQVTYDCLLDAAKEPHNWLTYFQALDARTGNLL